MGEYKNSQNTHKTQAKSIESLRNERFRRKLSDSYAVLQSLVPNLISKATRENIVSRTIEYVRELEDEISILEKLKQSMSVPENMEANSASSTFTNRRSSVSITVSGGVVFFGIQAALRRNLTAAKILRVFDKFGVEILAANVAVDEQRQELTVTVTARVSGGDGGKEITEQIKREILFI